jgi:hypothetical protein
MAKKRQSAPIVSLSYEPTSPLAMQRPGGLVDPYNAEMENKPLKKRGITKFGPNTTTEAIAYSNAPSLKDVLTIAWDRPDFNMLKLRPRYDGRQHRIPEGNGIPIRKKR